MRISDHALNRLNLLKAIRRWGPVARTDLPKHIGLSSGSITQLTAELLGRGLIVERKETGKRPGRPRQYLEINAGGAVVLGVSLAGIGILDVAYVDLMGNRLHAEQFRLGRQPTLAAMAAAIAECLATSIASSPFAQSQISRVGIAIPGLVDSLKGNVHFMTTFPLGQPVAFAGPISDRLGLPVTIENDMTCMARAEHWFGRARDLDTFMLIHVGFAIGSAQYWRGLPKSGANGFNTELGHVKSATGDNARACFCGGRGCLTAYASMYGIMLASGELNDAPFPPTTSLGERFERYIDQADAGNVAAQQALHQAGACLGLTLANFINATDPGNILITFASARFLAAIRIAIGQALQAHTLAGVLPTTTIDLIVVDDDWRWRGTAALALEQTYLGT